jgi:Putative MetA-pathway of phenol degradation
MPAPFTQREAHPWSIISPRTTIRDPFVLGWHSERWHAVVATDITAPTGAYDKNDARVSLGANYWSFEPIVAFTYRDEYGFDLSTKVMYNIKARNGATQYRSGDEIHLDFLAGKNFGAWGIGAGGPAGSGSPHARAVQLAARRPHRGAAAAAGLGKESLAPRVQGRVPGPRARVRAHGLRASARAESSTMPETSPGGANLSS